MNFGTKARQPSLDTLKRYGNTSSSSIFYILAYIEHNAGVKRGGKVRVANACHAEHLRNGTRAGLL